MLPHAQFTKDKSFMYGQEMFLLKIMSIKARLNKPIKPPNLFVAPRITSAINYDSTAEPKKYGFYESVLINHHFIITGVGEK